MFFQVAAATCLSQCAITRTPSRSTVIWPSASGASLPASDQTRWRTAARAARIAVRDRVPVAAMVSISREMVGSEASGPNWAGSWVDVG